MAKDKGLGLLMIGSPEKEDSKPESEDTGKSAMTAASAAAMGAVQKNDSEAFQKAMRELFHAFMMAGPPKK